MEINYNLSPCDLKKIKKFKNPTIKLYKNKINKNSKYTLWLTVKQFNELIKNDFIMYKFTDYRKKKALMIGWNLLSSVLNLGRNLLPSVLPFVKKALPAISLGVASTVTNELIKKKMNSKKIKNKQVVC